MNETYKNPENADEIMNRIVECPTLKEVMELLTEIFPTWIRHGFENYSKDYDYLQSNWYNVANMTDSTPKVIIVVGHYGDTEDYSIIRTFAEIFTHCGFCIRKEKELVGCVLCGAALLSPTVYEISTNPANPAQWKDRCQTECRPIRLEEPSNKIRGEENV